MCIVVAKCIHEFYSIMQHNCCTCMLALHYSYGPSMHAIHAACERERERESSTFVWGTNSLGAKFLLTSKVIELLYSWKITDTNPSLSFHKLSPSQVVSFTSFSVFERRHLSRFHFCFAFSVFQLTMQGHRCRTGQSQL